MNLHVGDLIGEISVAALEVRNVQSQCNENLPVGSLMQLQGMPANKPNASNVLSGMSAHKFSQSPCAGF